MPRPNVHQYAVYLLTNRWKNALYTGVTNSLERRVWQHKNGASMNPEWKDLAADSYGDDSTKGIPRRLRGAG